ncbi:MAG: discoidin domain-containing protein [Aridibacter sp.]
MKICPQCQSKYTDDTLKFCLQDGSILNSVSDEKTLVLDEDSFSNEETINDNFAETPPNFAQKTVEFSKSTADTEAFAENPSNETIKRQREVSEPTISANYVQPKKGGLSFLTGLIISILLIGLIGLGILGFLYLPAIIGKDANRNTNIANSNTNQPKIISDSDFAKVSASSTRKSDKGNLYNPQFAFDGNARTAWCEGAKGAGIGQWIVFDFKEEVVLQEIIIQPGYFKTSELWNDNNRLSSADFIFSDKSKQTFNFPNEMTGQKLNVGGVKTKSVMIAIKDIYKGKKDKEDTLISEVKFVVE